MYGPKSRRQCAQLNSFYAAAFDKRDRILEVVVSILRAIGRENSARRHWLAVDSFDDAQLVGADFNQGHFAHDFLKRKLDEMQSGLQHVCLNTDFAFRSYDSSGRHFFTQVPSFLDRDFARTDVHEVTLGNDEHHDQSSDADEEPGQHRCDLEVFHCYISFSSTGGS